MRRHLPASAAVTLGLLLLAGCGSRGEGETTLASTEVDLVAADGTEVGSVAFAEADGGVRVDAELTDLTPGFHGFHLHDVPTCDADAPDGPFTSAEGHWNPDGADHGEHAGDLVPLYVTADGTAELAFVTDRFVLTDVADHGGVAVMVHADPDNLGNVPDRYTAEDADAPGPDEDTTNTGDAGDRAACGVLSPED
jgi:superoxide dismutase, Cu-Zn family